jgi:CelD/BcsL family acetyltransferase involved in cellulose biosynthesis
MKQLCRIWSDGLAQTWHRMDMRNIVADVCAQVSNEFGIPLGSRRSHYTINNYIPGATDSRVVRLIEHEAAFELLEKPWSLLAAAASARPFQDFYWAKAWVQTIGRAAGRKLRVATVWEGSRLLAVLPLVRRRYLGARLLEWIGARVTDYCDVLVDPGIDASSALLALWSAVLARGDCDVIRLGQVRSDAKISGLFQAARLDPWVETREQTYFVPIHWGSGEEWLNEQSTHARKQAKYDLRRLAKAGFEYYVWQSPDAYEPVLEAVIAQKSAWLASKGLGLLLGHPDGPQFLRKCAAAMAARGTLHLSAFRSSRGFAACHLGFYQNGVLYGYMPTYDSAWASYSPGMAIRDALIMWACDHGARSVDLLRGVDKYKLRYQPEYEPLQTFVIPRGAIGKACVSAYRHRHLRQHSAAWPQTSSHQDPLPQTPH